MRGVWNPASLTCLGVVMEPAAPRASPGSVSCRPVIPGSEGTFAPPAVPWDETVPDGLSAGGGGTVVREREGLAPSHRRARWLFACLFDSFWKPAQFSSGGSCTNFSDANGSEFC